MAVAPLRCERIAAARGVHDQRYAREFAQALCGHGAQRRQQGKLLWRRTPLR